MPAMPSAISSLPPTVHDAPSQGGWAAPISPARRSSRWRLRLALLGGAGLCAAWLGVKQVPWFGPLVADQLRSLLGSARVTQLEEAVAGVEDRVQKVVSDGKARNLSDATPPELLPAATDAEVTHDAVSPRRVGFLYPETASAEDGLWRPVATRAGQSASIYSTIVHPDSERPYAELFVFALDLSKLRVQAVAGSIEPKSADPAPDAPRPGVVPEGDRDALVAAFNGGFKAEHGRFGMMVDGTELLAPKPRSCTFAATSDGSLRIAPWGELAGGAGLGWWRQTPGCMVQNGQLHAGLRSEDSRNWGATLEGKTVIRRSAVGLAADGRTLFVGISNSTTARALALGMQHAGARDVAQLDVNFSFPRFVLYREAEGGKLTAVGAVKGLLYQKDEYVGRASTRDFFYVTARP